MKQNFLGLLNKIDPAPSTPGKALKAFRTSLSLTLKELESISHIKEPNLSALENDRLEMTFYYAEVLAASLGIHPMLLLFPNKSWVPSKDLLGIKKRAEKIIGKKRVG